MRRRRAPDSERRAWRLRADGEGRDILFGRETILLRSDPLTRRGRREKVPADLDDATDRILSALKRKRRELAHEEGVPAYVIFADRTLIDMAGKRPATLDDLLAVHGVGERKVARYGYAFLEALEEALR